MNIALEAEQSVLGGLLLDNNAYDRLGMLSKEDFARADHQTIFAETKRLIEAGKPVDVITLSEKLAGVCDIAYLASLETNTPSVSNIGHYAKIVRETAQRRKLLTVGIRIQEDAAKAGADTAAVIDMAQSELEKIAENRESNEPVLASDDLADYLNELERREEGNGTAVFATGFADLDRKMSGGLRGGDLCVIAGRPKTGKTSLAMNIAVNISYDHPVLFLSQEMKRRQLHDRNVASIGKVDLSHLLNPKQITTKEMDGVGTAVATISALKLYVDDQGGLRLMDVRVKARGVARKHGLKVLVIDYLQLMVGEGANRNAEIEGITRGLKALALEMDIAIILLSQLNRSLESRPNKRPLPSDLRDSGAIEQDCDMALFMYRDEVYHPETTDKGICEVNVGLIRQGEPGTVGLVFEGQYSKFSNLERGRLFGQAAPKPKYSNGLRD
ncbi:replicative DNA helicase [Advenella mimigardefordensis]|uniref:Replicative DNA helicase n=1 Tax=Advenella mimigardefordensis (strain DSM 17166 / LMG 22922 / DPN7) TaxID=1247726 RepID=W0PDQ4_ADVMD|nr:replicative DNA helicase [Advenella mimigardefordensis]AHG63168.1 replicative DNA helicase [Advenella mimigardefordensis DPN7]